MIGVVVVLAGCVVFVAFMAALCYWIAILGADWPPGSGRQG